MPVFAALIIGSCVFAQDGMDDKYLHGLDRSSVRLVMQVGVRTQSAMAVPVDVPETSCALVIFGIEP